MTVKLNDLSHDGIDNHLNFLPSLAKDIVQQYVHNPDYSTEELLIRCGALTCSQTNFFALLEMLLHPVVRRGDEQNELAMQLNAVLRPV